MAESPKLAVAMCLLQQGWEPIEHLSDTLVLECNGAKQFWTSKKFAAPKNYYVCLAKSSSTFVFFRRGLSDLPQVI